MTDNPTRLENIIKIIESLPDHRLLWVEKVTDILNCPHTFVLKDETFMTEDWCLSFGDALMIHHAFSNEPFTKDKFEHALVNTAKMVKIEADFAPRGNRGHDIEIDNIKYSLKTQADKSIKKNLIWISKYMELGKGEWTDQPEQLKGLVQMFLDHLKESSKILTLRCLDKTPIWKYELIEIPKEILERSKAGQFRMMTDSKQMPKPGYCTIISSDGKIDFQLYFDGGTERKLQVKGLRKSLCRIIAEWTFQPNVLEDN
jgi:hypothetical protein